MHFDNFLIFGIASASDVVGEDRQRSDAMTTKWGLEKKIVDDRLQSFYNKIEAPDLHGDRPSA